jgi:hypothetical protein
VRLSCPVGDWTMLLMEMPKKESTKIMMATVNRIIEHADINSFDTFINGI